MTKKRNCSMCEKPLDYDEFIKSNFGTDNKLNRIWNDDRIAIPCCKCHSFLTLAQDKGINNTIRATRDFYDYDIFINIIEKLADFGMIDKNTMIIEDINGFWYDAKRDLPLAAMVHLYKIHKRCKFTIGYIGEHDIRVGDLVRFEKDSVLYVRKYD